MDISYKFKQTILKSAIWLIAVFGIGVLFPSEKAYAITGISIQIPKISSSHIQIIGVSFNADWLISQDVELKAKVQNINLTDLQQTLEGVDFSCKKARFDGEIFSCKDGVLLVQNEYLQKQKLSVSIKHSLVAGESRVVISGATFFGGKQELKIRIDNGNLIADIIGDIKVQKLKQFLADLSSEHELQTLEGLVDVKARVQKNAQSPVLLDATVDIKELSVEGNNSSGIYQLNSQSIFNLQIDKEKVGYDIHTDINQGFFYLTRDIDENTQQFYSFEPSRSMSFDSLGNYHFSKQALAVDSILIQQEGVLNLDASVFLEFAQELKISNVIFNLTNLDIEPILAQLDYPAFPFLAKDNLELTGNVSAALSGNNILTNKPIVTTNVELKSLNYSYDEQSLGVNDVSGIISWNSSNSANSSTIRWDSGNFQLIPFDGSVLNFKLGVDSLFIDKFKLPVLGGDIVVDSVSVQELGAKVEEYKYKLGVQVADIELAQLTTALQWPLMEGTINAGFPMITFGDNLIEFGGSATIDLFDGSMTLQNMQIEDPLGVVPRMSGDLGIKELDLEQLSSTLQFGRITGKLNGHAHDISLEQWFPVKMDMSLYTHEDDDTKRRISQKAVDFISDIGGVGGSLSRTYLRFFDEFSYDKIGINLKLEDGVCNITGIEPAANGYYIVKGSFIPRIDIVGYESQVSWLDLVDQVKQAMQRGAPTTE